MIKCIKLTSPEIVSYWNIIKFASYEVNGVGEEDAPKAGVALAENLLNGKCQCWFVISEERAIKTVLLTHIIKDDLGFARLMVAVQYGYLKTTTEERTVGINALIEFAKNIGCKSVIGYTDNPMAMKVMESVGMVDRYRLYERMVA